MVAVSTALFMPPYISVLLRPLFTLTELVIVKFADAVDGPPAGVGGWSSRARGAAEEPSRGTARIKSRA